MFYSRQQQTQQIYCMHMHMHGEQWTNNPEQPHPAVSHTQPALPHQQEVVYDNRIFNLKKKYTLPTSLPSKQNQQTTNHMPKYKHSYFAKYLDTINKHHPLLRRGACDAALPNNYANPLTHRDSRIKTEASCVSKQAEYFRSANHSQTSKKARQQECKQVDLKNVDKNLPSLSVRSTCKVDELLLPIRVERFVSKGVGRTNLWNKDEAKQAKRLMLRKLQVQLINYSLLGKWGNSALKS